MTNNPWRTVSPTYVDINAAPVISQSGGTWHPEPVPHYPSEIPSKGPAPSRRDPSFMMGKMSDAERAAWVRLEEARAKSASAEHLHDLTQNAADRSNSVKAIKREAYENGLER